MEERKQDSRDGVSKENGRHEKESETNYWLDLEGDEDEFQEEEDDFHET